LVAEEYDGFWLSMDTFKDKQRLEDLCARQEAPWMVWNGDRRYPTGGTSGNCDSVRISNPARG
jgi:hypothetical protein